ALAYYTLFSLFPIFLVIWSIVAKVAPIIVCNTLVSNLINGSCDSAADASYALLQLAQTLPDDAYRIVERTFTRLQQDSTGASIVGSILLFFSASNVFGALDRSVQKMWHVHRKTQGRQNLIGTVSQFILNRIFAFALVLGSAALMMISLLSKIAIGVLENLLTDVDSKITFIRIDDLNLISGVQLGATLLMLMIVIMTLFKILPPVRIRWQDVIPSSLFTAMLFVGLQNLASNSIVSIGSRFQSYGVIGGVMVLMFWIYVTWQIFLLGNAFTYVYAHSFGSLRDRHPYRQ
ncbi:MAG: YihY/virulence factor BrkB family protein, partial [Merismopedia sp. SIO2A8]|nr:YihY/virulence factor BrkB family protein [Merismopedia sp. SIO2A8]